MCLYVVTSSESLSLNNSYDQCENNNVITRYPATTGIVFPLMRWDRRIYVDILNLPGGIMNNSINIYEWEWHRDFFTDSHAAQIA